MFKCKEGLVQQNQLKKKNDNANCCLHIFQVPFPASNGKDGKHRVLSTNK